MCVHAYACTKTFSLHTFKWHLFKGLPCYHVKDYGPILQATFFLFTSFRKESSEIAGNILGEKTETYHFKESKSKKCFKKEKISQLYQMMLKD